MPLSKKELKREFFRRVPKARPWSPVHQSWFDFMYAAHLLAKPGTRLLNIYASWDFSGNREEVYREKFFSACEYEALDFREDRFVHPAKKEGEDRHRIPFPDQHFDVIVTTKYIMEHISEPETVIQELYRTLKPGGEVFVVAAHVRRQHQKPYDFFRFTEFGLEYLFKKAGFAKMEITASNGWAVTLTSYAYFFERSIPMPRMVERFFDSIYYYIVEPLGFFLDRLDNGYGRDLSLYYLIRAKR